MEAKSSYKSVTHVIFDLDGLLLDTEKLYTIATGRVASRFGKAYPWELKVSQMGHQSRICAQKIITGLDLPITVDEYLDEIMLYKKELFPSSELMRDTERLYSEATQAVASEYNKTYTWDLKVTLMGMKGTMACEKIISELQLPLTVDEYLEKIGSIYEKSFPTACLLPGVDRLIRHLHRNNVPIAIASGGAKESFELKTTYHKEFIDLFSHVVLASTDPEVKHGKPEPDVFLACAQRFPEKPAPGKCLVFEDAPNGVAAAVAAGMQVIMVPDERMDPALTKGASLILSSIEDFKPELFGLPPYDTT